MPGSRKGAARHYEGIIGEAAAVCSPRELNRFEPFLRHYYAHLAPEVLHQIPARYAAEGAYRHWKLARQRPAGKALVRAYNLQDEHGGDGGTQTVLEVVTDDMPFLVDSVRMETNRQGYTINLAVHPVFEVERNRDRRLTAAYGPSGASKKRESFIRLEVDRIFDTGALEALEKGVASVLADVRRAVGDWSKIRNRLHEDIRALDAGVPGVAGATVAEVGRFLNWLDEKNFTFLGYERVRIRREKQKRRFETVPRSALGILRGPGHELRGESADVEDIGRRRRYEQLLLLVTKSGQRATVHRPGYLDYIAVRHFDNNGRIVGESRFVGLYTSWAYRRHPRDVPLIRNKIEATIERAGYDPLSHTGKTFLHILETFPRDELFQISVDELYATASAILHLGDRQRVKLFVREDRLRRFVTCMVYVPRDRYDTDLRVQMSDILGRGFDAEGLDFNVRLTDESFARVEYFIQTDPENFPSYNVTALEKELERASRTWADDLRQAIHGRYPDHDCAALLSRYAGAFAAAYQDDFDAGTAVEDIELLEQLDEARPLRVKLYRGEAAELRLKLYKRGEPVAPSDSLPILENMGVKVVQEKPYRVSAGGTESVWIHDHRLECRDCDRDVIRFKADFEEIFAAVWFGGVENDGFNALGLLGGLSAREISLLRAYCKYLLQAGLTYSQIYMEQCLQKHPDIAADLQVLFATCFDPAQQSRGTRAKVSRIKRRIRAGLEAVAGRDEDRILRNFFGVIRATLRTNYYCREQRDHYIAFKFDTARVPELPAPRPMYEIFVYSPRMEGIHLRSGKVARGGLRWSDRREDFRTEVLRLVKAQKVKNAVIVPTGAKGGFVVKQPPSEGGREAFTEEGIACYRQFIAGLLDLTDNRVDERIVPPAEVVRYDGDDNYLVVAADKGTASFSDIANELALSRDFWLGDAFASGGSNGYDHKKMGITARGAWESVRLHFRDLGLDVDKHPFTVAGIGDMGGDVFGNGMLLSKQVKLVAAFNHMHIFLDPDPDPAASFKERRRLFNLSRSTWEDYNPELISKGGGVYSRDAKSIRLTAPVKKLLDTDADSLAPAELIQLILQAPVDLLWNGGIGTYVKGEEERHADVGDRANDQLRIDAGQLRCRVIGEGGNLGLTQQGRIEYALNGGRVDTDFIHNAGGVDCSDHEVNIKILLNKAKAAGSLTETRRVKLLGQMTEEVADLVLQSNYWQAVAITLIEVDAARLLDEHARFVYELESGGHLDRGLEGLPTEEQLVERKAADRGLTRPEIAVLLSYSKSVAQEALVDSDLWDEAYFSNVLLDYFPSALRGGYGELIRAHPLRCEILAMRVVNRMINRMGCTYLFRMQEETGAGYADITRAYTIAWEVFNLEALWARIAALDNRVPAEVQIRMMLEVARLSYRASKWLIHNRKRALSVEQGIADYRGGAEVLLRQVPRMIEVSEDPNIQAVRDTYIGAGVDEDLAVRIVGMDALYCTFDVVDISARLKLSVQKVMDTYFAVSAYLDIYWLRVQMRDFEARTHWQDLARKSHLDELYRVLGLLTTEVLRAARRNDSPQQAIERWHRLNSAAVDRCLRVPQELKAVERLDLAMFTVALRELQNLHQASGAG